MLDELTALVCDYPAHEAFHAQLMVALYRSSKRAAAITMFHNLRRSLGETLAMEPLPAMYRLYEAILAVRGSLIVPSKVMSREYDGIT